MRQIVEHFSGLKLIKIERTPSPIIILPSLSAAQSVDISEIAKQHARKVESRRQNAIDAWHMNNSNASKRAMPALKSATGRRGQFALFASTMSAGHSRRSGKGLGKSTVITPMSSRSNSQNNSNNSSMLSNTSTIDGSTLNGNGMTDMSSSSSSKNHADTSLGTGNSKSKLLRRQEMKRDSMLGTSKEMLYMEGDSKPWVCKTCNRTYKWKNSLNCHIKNECGKPPKFFCERLCGYKTNIHSNMKRHMNSNCKPRSAV